MSKNITIQEGGVAKQFTAQKLQTNLVGGGTQLWVPEDEAGDYANLEELSVTENGTYVPSENADGFSKVEVDVNPELEDITITRNGVYKSKKYGYGRIDVDVEGGGDAETGSLTVTENGTYYASDDELDGYDEVIVDVHNGIDIKGTTIVEGTVMANLSAGDTVYFTSHTDVLTPITNTGMLGTLFGIGERFAWTTYNNSILVYRLTTVPATLYKTITPTRGGTIPTDISYQYGGAGAVVIQEFVSSESKTYWSLYASDDPDTCLGTIEYPASSIVNMTKYAASAKSKIGVLNYAVLDFANGTYYGTMSSTDILTVSEDYAFIFDAVASSGISKVHIYDKNGNLYGTTKIKLHGTGYTPGFSYSATVDNKVFILCPMYLESNPIACFYISDILANVNNTDETALDPFMTFDRPTGSDISDRYSHQGYYVEINDTIFGIQKMETGYSLFWGDESNPTENSMAVSATDITTITSSYILLSNGSLYANNAINTIQPANNTIHGNSKLGVVTQAYSAGDKGTATIIFS